MLSISRVRLVAVSRLRDVDLASSNMQLAVKATSRCTCTLRKWTISFPPDGSHAKLAIGSGPEMHMVEKAKELCEDLIANVKEQFEAFKNRPPRTYNGGGGYGDRGYSDRGHGNNSSSYHGYENNRRHDNHHHGNNSSYSNSPAPPPPAVSSASPPETTATSGATATDYTAAQYAQYAAGGADPYAAYGGYTA